MDVHGAWAQQLAAQNQDPELKKIFTPLAEQLTAHEAIVAEYAAVQGKPTDVGGYYRPDEAKAAAALRPSPSFNRILGDI